MTRAKSLVASAMIFTLAAGCVSQPGGPRPAPGATGEGIVAEDMALRIGILAHDSMMGREAGTPGAVLAASYLIRELERLGLEPGGDDGGYLHSVPLERKHTRATVTVSDAAGSRMPGPDEILPVAGLAGLPQASRESGFGPLVFGGHLVDPAVTPDEELGIEQLRNAAVIVRLGIPAGVDPNAAQPRVPMAMLFSPASPAAAVLLIAEETEEEFWDYAAEIGLKGAVSLAGAGSAGFSGPPFFLITPEFAEELLGSSLATARRPLPDLGTFQFRLDETTEPFEGWNVVGILPGSDPSRSTEYIGLGAHYDHVGIGVPVDGDSIYNGADDNASGTAALLEVAEALAHLPLGERPARSVLIAWKTAEESGLLGSEHFTDSPTVDRGAIITHINLDMVGRNHPDSLFSVGSRRLASELGDIVEAVNERQERPFAFDYSYDTPGHPEQIYCRSDHYSYARFGIPIVFLTTGLHEDYHAPSDEAHLIDNDKAARVAGLVFDLTLELANRAERPAIDQSRPPFGSECS